MNPHRVNPLLWHQSVGMARQTCARVFRDGGTPADALAAFGLAVPQSAPADWSHVVETIAAALCSSEPLRRAA